MADDFEYIGPLKSGNDDFVEYVGPLKSATPKQDNSDMGDVEYVGPLPSPSATGATGYFDTIHNAFKEPGRIVADVALQAVTMSISWGASKVSEIIARSLTDDPKFADEIKNDVARRTGVEPISVTGKFIMEHAEPIFKSITEEIRGMIEPFKTISGINPDPDRPLMSGKLYQHSPLLDILQFAGEGMAFKKGGELGGRVKGVVGETVSGIRKMREALDILKQGDRKSVV